MEKNEILDSIREARQQIQNMRQYHLRASLTELELQFDPASLVAVMLTDQFGKVIREHTLQLIKRLGRAVKVDANLNSSEEDIRKELEVALDKVGHKIIKRHFNEAFDRTDEILKAMQVEIQCRLNGMEMPKLAD